MIPDEVRAALEQRHADLLRDLAYEPSISKADREMIALLTAVLQADRLDRLYRLLLSEGTTDRLHLIGRDQR